MSNHLACPPKLGKVESPAMKRAEIEPHRRVRQIQFEHLAKVPSHLPSRVRHAVRVGAPDHVDERAELDHTFWGAGIGADAGNVPNLVECQG